MNSKKNRRIILESTGDQGAGQAGTAGQKGCIFCSLATGQVQSKRIYEDAENTGILDINPANPGHTLVIPKMHAPVLLQMKDSQIRGLFTAVKRVSHLLLRALKAGGTSVFLATGEVAGQRAPHLMVHVIPRLEGDSFRALETPGQQMAGPDLDAVRKKLIQNLKTGQGDDAHPASRPGDETSKMPQEGEEQKSHPESHEDAGQGRQEQEGHGDEPESADLDVISGLFRNS